MKIIRDENFKKMKIKHNWKLLIVIIALIILLVFVVKSILKNSGV